MRSGRILIIVTLVFSIFSLTFSIIYLLLAFTVGLGGALYEHSRGDRGSRNALAAIVAVVTMFWLAFLTLYGVL